MKPNKKTGAAVLITAALEAIGVCASKSTPPILCVGGCCSYKVVAVGFHTLCYGARSAEV